MTGRVKLNRVLIRINRYIAYALLLIAVVILVTGYRTTGHFAFFSRGFADITHRIHLNIAFIVLLAVHALLSIRSALLRKKIGGAYIDIMLLLIGTVFVGLFVLLVFV
ncbi:MAG TPA: hypothetical protein VMZ05_10790 [Spirochaetota bacterium]|nr:hypothetical protein [Spirochaetota bacterium]